MKHYILAVALMLAAAPASAYTTYILPDEFGPADNDLTAQASFASQFFTPGIAVSADFQMITPDGGTATFDRVEVAGQATTMRTGLSRWGTYRITSGERLGRVSTLIGEAGTWRQLGEGEAPPEGAELTTLQTVTVAEAYFSRGEPTREALERPVGRLSIRPVTHPNQVLLSSGFEVELLWEGQPFPNMAIVIYEEGDADTNVETYVATDARGRATIAFEHPGNYLIAARHRAAAPAGSEAAVRSYTTSLTFNVLTALPDYPEPPEQDRPRRRRSDLGMGR
jgi:hypothetical protein